MNRVLPVLLVSLMFCRVAPGVRVVLFDRHADVDQKTEVRYDAPAGRVITGLGFRANHDNITTMQVRHHLLTDAGSLTDPCEVRLGSEPDHACEAAVMLPKGYIAVGFGAAGEPEWDVTVLHVWARPLGGDGTLGPMECFSDGFKPDRDSERSFILTQADRALTGAGLRFGFNDITGIYAASQRVLALSEAQSRRIGAFSRHKVWMLRSAPGVNPDLVAESLADLGPERLDMFVDTAHIGDDGMMTGYRSLAAAAGRHGATSMAWAATTDTGQVNAILKDPAGFAGVVLDACRIARPQLGVSDVGRVADLCRRADKALALRLDPADTDRWQSLVGVVLSLPQDVSVIVRLPSGSPQRGGGLSAALQTFTGRDLLVEIDLAGTEPPYPDIRIDQLPGLVVDAALAGAGGFVAPVDSSSPASYLPTGLNGMNLHALHILAGNPFIPIDTLWDEVSLRRFGRGAGPAAAALKRTAAANRLIFLTLGVDVLRQDGRLLAIPQMRQRVESMLAQPAWAGHKDVLAELLDPTDKSISRAAEDKETAHWLLAQSKADAQAAFEAEPSDATSRLKAGIEDLDRAAQYLRTATDAWLHAGMYAVDGADQTRDRALAAAAQLRGSELNGTPLGAGVEAFVASVEDAIRRGEQAAALTVALADVERLASTGQDDEAAVQSLLDTLDNGRLAPHLEKRWQAVGAAASRLAALWSRPDNLRVCWGGDGRWTVEKVAGRWCWVIGENRPCLYLDVPGPALPAAADYTIHFEYFDRGDWTIHFEYDSDFPETDRRQYHGVEPLKLTNTNQWKQATFAMPRCLFASSQNLLADMRFVTGRGACIRNIRLEKP